MTITRLWQAGAEWQQAGLEFSSVSDPLFTTSATEKRTAGYAFRTESKHYGVVQLSASYAQLRVGFWVKSAGVVGGNNVRLLSLWDNVNGEDALILRWDGTNFGLYSQVGGSALGTAASAAMAAGSWVHIGLDVKINDTGWAYLYLDGVAAITFTGDTAVDATDIDQVLFGGVQNFNNEWSQYLYLDDLYIDSTTGEGAPAVVPTYRFDFVYPNGAGVHDGEFNGSDSNNVDNYLLLDEQPHDSDTTYVHADAVGTTESCTMTDITLDAGWQPNAVIAMAVARKTETASTLGAKLSTYTTSAGAATSSKFDLATSYGLIWERRTLQPDASPWDEAAVDDLHIGVEVS